MGINFVVFFNLALSSVDVVIPKRLERVFHPIHLLLVPSIHGLACLCNADWHLTATAKSRRVINIVLDFLGYRSYV